MTGPRAHRFPKGARIVRRSDFVGIQKEGRRFQEGFLRIGWRRRADSRPARLGVAVSLRLGGAPRRNRIKRILREVFRQHRTAFPPGVDLVVIPQDGRQATRYARVRETLLRAAARLGREAAASRAPTAPPRP